MVTSCPHLLGTPTALYCCSIASLTYSTPMANIKLIDAQDILPATSPLGVGRRKPLLRCCHGRCTRRRLPGGESTLKVSDRGGGLCLLIRVTINQVRVDSGGGPLCSRGWSTDEPRARESLHGLFHGLVGGRRRRRRRGCWSRAPTRHLRKGVRPNRRSKRGAVLGYSAVGRATFSST